MSNFCNKFMMELCAQVADNFSGKEFTVNDLMEHFDEITSDSDSDGESKPKPKKTKKEKKAKKVKDPNAPKKPTNSYMFYSKHMRSEAGEDVKFSAKQLGVMWKEVSSDEPETKAKFDEMAKEDLERYNTEKEEYEASQ